MKWDRVPRRGTRSTAKPLFVGSIPTGASRWDNDLQSFGRLPLPHRGTDWGTTRTPSRHVDFQFDPSSVAGLLAVGVLAISSAVATVPRVSPKLGYGY